MHIPGSEKLVLELPLVIGTVPYSGLSSRSSSMSSQESTASASWVSLRMPSCPPSYCDVTRDSHLDQPLTPLLDDYDGGDSPIFMNSPKFSFPPLPPYSEVGLDLLPMSSSFMLASITVVLQYWHLFPETQKF